MLLPIGMAYNFTPYNWGLVALFQQNLARLGQNVSCPIPA